MYHDAFWLATSFLKWKQITTISSYLGHMNSLFTMTASFGPSSCSDVIHDKYIELHKLSLCKLTNHHRYTIISFHVYTRYFKRCFWLIGTMLIVCVKQHSNVSHNIIRVGEKLVDHFRLSDFRKQSTSRPTLDCVKNKIKMDNHQKSILLTTSSLRTWCSQT